MLKLRAASEAADNEAAANRTPQEAAAMDAQVEGLRAVEATLKNVLRELDGD